MASDRLRTTAIGHAPLGSVKRPGTRHPTSPAWWIRPTSSTSSTPRGSRTSCAAPTDASPPPSAASKFESRPSSPSANSAMTPERHRDRRAARPLRLGPQARPFAYCTRAARGRRSPGFHPVTGAPAGLLSARWLRTTPVAEPRPVRSYGLRVSYVGSAATSKAPPPGLRRRGRCAVTTSSRPCERLETDRRARREV
jgi:hypothetical protein